MHIPSILTMALSKVFRKETQNFALFCLIEDSASREVLFGCYINYTGTPNMNAAITGIRTERWTKISFLVRINICSPLQMRKTVTCSMHENPIFQLESSYSLDAAYRMNKTFGLCTINARKSAHRVRCALLSAPKNRPSQKKAI